MNRILVFCMLYIGLVATSGCGSVPAQANPSEGNNCLCDDNHTHPPDMTTRKFEFTCIRGETGQYVVAENVPIPDAITGYARSDPNQSLWTLGTGLRDRNPNAYIEPTDDESGTLKVDCTSAQGNKVSIVLLYAP